MKTFIRVLLLTTITLLTFACASKKEGFRKGSGELGDFIILKAANKGAKPVSTNNLPPITFSWSFFEDENGVIIRTAAEEFGNVEKFLLTTFGKPTKEPIPTTDGGKLGWYARKEIGVGIQFGIADRRTQVIIMGPVSMEEIIKRIPKALEHSK